VKVMEVRILPGAPAQLLRLRLAVMEVPGDTPQGIVVQQPGGHVRVFRDRFIAGSDVGAAVFLDDPYASPWHASFTPVDGIWQVSDLGTTNGTWVDGVIVRHPRQLAKGSRVRIGRTTLTVVPVNVVPAKWDAIVLPA